MSYSPEVLARVRTPQRIGALAMDDPSVAVGEAGTLESGTLARISIRVDAQAERIDEVRFRVFGCSAAIASASLVSEWMEHAPLDEARGLTAERVVAALALPADREHVAALAVEAGRRAIASWEQRRSAEAGARSAGGSAPAIDRRWREAEPMIEITESAARIIDSQLSKQNLAGGGLRIGVKAGGCSGFSYVFAFESSPKASDQIFAGPGGTRVFVDPRSLRLLDGTVLDYDEANLMATNFTLRNPNAQSTCGCGESFSA